MNNNIINYFKDLIGENIDFSDFDNTEQEIDDLVEQIEDEENDYSDYCICPNCSYTDEADDTPCEEKTCPQCNTPMIGACTECADEGDEGDIEDDIFSGYSFDDEED